MSTQPAAQTMHRLGRALGTSGTWRRRLLLHHLPIAVVSALVFLLFLGLSLFTAGGYPDLDNGAPDVLPQPRAESRIPELDGGVGLGFQLPSRLSISRLTVATGYVATGLLALTLLVGPANLLLRKRNPVSSYLRRDLGAWTAIYSIVHVILGLQLHGGRQLSGFLNYFVTTDGRPRTNSFGLGNWTGLAATVIVVGLLAISTDRSLRELKARRWKNLQRLNYALFALVLLHAFFYGALLRMTSPFTLLLFSVVFTVLVGQATGIWLWRRRQTRIRHPRAQQPSQLSGVP